MEDNTRPTPILSYGMGVESTGILVRWILEPATRDFELNVPQNLDLPMGTVNR